MFVTKSSTTMLDLYYKLLEILGGITRLGFRNNFTAGKNFKLFLGGGVVGTKKKITIGNNVKLFGWLISDGGTIIIGDNTIIHRNTFVRSMNKVTIGKHCDIGSDVYIQDHNSMSLNYLERRKCTGEIKNKPVSIGNDVWIGRRVMVLKGVHIGERAVIGAGAVVTHDVMRDGVAVGNPARVVKLLKTS